MLVRIYEWTIVLMMIYNSIFRNNTIVNFYSITPSGIYHTDYLIGSSATLLFENNIIAYENGSGDIIDIIKAVSLTAYNNLIYDVSYTGNIFKGTTLLTEKDNFIDIDPLFIDPDYDIYYLSDSSPALNAGKPRDGWYRHIGAYGSANIDGYADTWNWDDWTDADDVEINTDASDTFEIYDVFGDPRLALRSGIAEGYAYSPIIYAGDNPRYFSVDAYVDEALELPSGAIQTFGNDDSSQNRDISIATSDDSSAMGIFEPGYYFNEVIDNTNSYIQVRIRFTKTAEY